MIVFMFKMWENNLFIPPRTITMYNFTFLNREVVKDQTILNKQRKTH